MSSTKEWFTVDVAKRAARVRSFPLEHVLKELLSNSLDSGAKNISLSCLPTNSTRMNSTGGYAYDVSCVDDGNGCDDPEVLRRVGSTTSDQDPKKRGRFGQGLIDVLAIAERATIHTLKSRLTFTTTGYTIGTVRTPTEGLRFEATIRHPADRGQYSRPDSPLFQFFCNVILPEGVRFSFNDVPVLPRVAALTVPDVKLPTIFFDVETETVRQRTQATTIRLYEWSGKAPRIFELGIPVMDFPWALPYSVDIGQKVPLDVDRLLLPPKYLSQVIAELMGPTSHLYEAYIEKYSSAPPELRDCPENAQRLSQAAQRAVVEATLRAPLDKVVRRNPLDADDRSEAQELEDCGYTPVNRGHLPAGVSALLADAPTVATTHNEVCKAHCTSGVLPPLTERQTACIAIFSEIASALVGEVVHCERHRGGAAAMWVSLDMAASTMLDALRDGPAHGQKSETASTSTIRCSGTIRLNINHQVLWDDPLGEEALGLIIHECGHAKVSGHCPEFTREVARLGVRLAVWVAKYPDRWGCAQLLAGS